MGVLDDSRKLSRAETHRAPQDAAPVHRGTDASRPAGQPGGDKGPKDFNRASSAGSSPSHPGHGGLYELGIDPADVLPPMRPGTVPPISKLAGSRGGSGSGSL